MQLFECWWCHSIFFTSAFAFSMLLGIHSTVRVVSSRCNEVADFVEASDARETLIFRWIAFKPSFASRHTSIVRTETDAMPRLDCLLSRYRQEASKDHVYIVNFHRKSKLFGRSSLLDSRSQKVDLRSSVFTLRTVTDSFTHRLAIMRSSSQKCSTQQRNVVSKQLVRTNS